MKTWKHELRACLRLAAPIALSQVAQVAMNLADTAIVTPLGAHAIGAVGLGHTAFFGLVWPFVGILLCLDTEASQAVGRQDPRAATRAFLQALWLWGGIVAVTATLVTVVAFNMENFGVNQEVAPLAGTYLRWTALGIAPLSFTFASTKFLQAHHRTRPVVVIAVGANVVNAICVYGLVHGKFGFPQWGILGAAIGTSICRTLIAVGHVIVLLRGDFPWEPGDARPHWGQIKELLALGVPAGLQMAMEIGIFSLSGFMIARFDPSMLAAHHILLQLATFTFMFPVGISAAASVRVGNAIGAGDKAQAALSGTVAIAFGACVMALSGVIMIASGTAFAHLFDAPPAVAAAFASLVGFAAAFQVFDGIQVTATGALRGLGDTRSAFYANAVGHWAVAFPLCMFFGFQQQMHARGVWLGLTAGLVVVALALLWVWRSHAGKLNPGGDAAKRSLAA